ncbi:MAG TPA: hypothetical protein VHE81_22215, partial [Lacipirellulaceae bacterium]|nr:hypothetical protein [Lacipirellulaceae bacterium]
PTRVIALRVLSPVPRKAILEKLQGVKRVVVLEQNHSGQLLKHLLATKSVPVSAEGISRPGPLPFRPNEIVRQLA